MTHQSKDDADWIRLAVRFKGKCATCGKEIPTGEIALWSRKDKAIKHVECSSEEGAEAKPSAPEPELDCFVCGKTAGCVQCSFADDCDRATVSHSCICPSCLERDAAGSDQYQKKFIERLGRLTKVKI